MTFFEFSKDSNIFESSIIAKKIKSFIKRRKHISKRYIKKKKKRMSFRLGDFKIITNVYLFRVHGHLLSGTLVGSMFQ